MIQMTQERFQQIVDDISGDNGGTGLGAMVEPHEVVEMASRCADRLSEVTRLVRALRNALAAMQPAIGLFSLQIDNSIYEARALLAEYEEVEDGQ